MSQLRTFDNDLYLNIANGNRLFNWVQNNIKNQAALPCNRV